MIVKSRGIVFLKFAVMVIIICFTLGEINAYASGGYEVHHISGFSMKIPEGLSILSDEYTDYDEWLFDLDELEYRKNLRKNEIAYFAWNDDYTLRIYAKQYSGIVDLSKYGDRQRMKLMYRGVPKNAEVVEANKYFLSDGDITFFYINYIDPERNIRIIRYFFGSGHYLIQVEFMPTYYGFDIQDDFPYVDRFVEVAQLKEQKKTDGFSIAAFILGLGLLFTALLKIARQIYIEKASKSGKITISKNTAINDYKKITYRFYIDIFYPITLAINMLYFYCTDRYCWQFSWTNGSEFFLVLTVIYIINWILMTSKISLTPFVVKESFILIELELNALILSLPVENYTVFIWLVFLVIMIVLAILFIKNVNKNEKHLNGEDEKVKRKALNSVDMVWLQERQRKTGVSCGKY